MPNIDGKALNTLAEIAGDGAITKSDLGLGNVDNTSDANKPVSTAVKGELDVIKENVAVNSAKVATVENLLNSMNPSQEASTTTSGVDTISLPKTASNAGMQVQLFGQSAQQLIQNGDFINGTTGWKVRNSTHSVSSGILTNTGDGTSTTAAEETNTTIQIIGSNKYYVRFRARVTGTGCTNLRLRSDFSAIVVNAAGAVQNQWYDKSDVVTIGGTSSSNRSILIEHSYATAADALGKVMEIDFAYIINLTATFGAGNEPTKEQCDLIYANYFEGSDNVLGTGRVRSVGVNLIDRNKLVDGYAIVNTGELLPTTTTFYNEYTLVKPGATLRWNPGGPSIVTGIAFYDKNKVLVGFFNSSTGFDGAVTVPNNAIYFRATFYKATYTFDNARVNYGTTLLAFSPFIQSALYLTTPELRSNGLIKDEIRKGTNGYELVKRVGVGTLGANGIAGGDFEGGLIGSITVQDEIATWSLNTTNPISGTRDGLLQVATAGVNQYRPLIGGLVIRASGQLRKFSFKYKVNSGTFTLAGFNTGSGNYLIPITLTGSGTYQRYYVADGTNGFALFFDGRNLFNAQIDDLKDELIAAAGLASGTGATVVTTELGSNVHYTLATPVITPISHAGLLDSNANGTTYFEPVIADAGVYSTKIDIQITDYPISSIERLVIYVDGVQTELSLTTGLTIAGDGLSFTHTGLTAGDLVMFTYAYNKESIGRSMTLTHYDNRYVVADTANGKVYTYKPTITNGVLTGWALTEV